MRVAVVTNLKSGSADTFSPDAIEHALTAAGVTCKLCPSQGHDLDRAMRQAIDHRANAIVAVGGDGTVSTVAAHIVKSAIDVPLGVIAGGTLNHFAKDLGIPLELGDAVKVIAAGNVRAVDVGAVNGRVFINNSSIGIYPHMVDKRDEIRQRLGRGKWSAMLMAVLTVFKRYPTVRVRINSPEIAFERKTPFLFVGNNRYEFSLNMLGKRASLDRHELSVYFTNRTGRFGLLRLAIRAVLGQLNQDKDFHAMTAPELWIDTNRRHLRVALDGETVQLTPPLRYQTRPGALKVLVPGANQSDALK